MQSFSKVVFMLLTAMMLSFAAPVYAQEHDSCTDDSCPLVLEENPTPAFDPVTYIRYHLPEGTRCEVGGETFQCFSLEEYRQLLEMDVDLQFYDEAYPIAQQTIVNLGNLADELRLALRSADSQVATLTVENNRLLYKWTKENRLRLEAENRPMLGSWVAWGLAATEAVVITILSLVLVGGSL
jgi:hypothetical protein